MTKLQAGGRLLAALSFAFSTAASARDLSAAVRKADRTAANTARNHVHHAAGLAGKPFNQDAPRPGAGAGRGIDGDSRDRYPGDLQTLGGPVVASLQSHAVFVNPTAACPAPSCWGDPEGFLADLGQSDFIHVVDQYVGAHEDNRYTLGDRVIVTAPLTNPMYDFDIVAVVHAAATATGQTGYGHEYHVFLPPGQDLCFSGFDVCYSPDNPNTFAFCAYHGSVDFPDIGHVLFSAQPYQNVFGCAVRPGTPNGALADSTNNVLSHELIETITDPDPPDAWFNILNSGIFFYEIADECTFITNLFEGPPAWDPSIWSVNGKRYATQPEYSNLRHACTVRGRPE
jgi:hypothetical protein